MYNNNNNKHRPNNVLESFIEELSLCLAAGLTFLGIKLSEGLVHLIGKFKERNSLKPITHKRLQSKKVMRSKNTVGYLLNDKKPLTYKSLDTKTHTGIFGSTGTGKTVLMKNLITQSLADNKAVIFFDPKPTEESKSAFCMLASKLGRRAYVFMPRTSSTKINFLVKGTVVENVNKIMNALEWSEVFYKNECQLALFRTITKINDSGERLTIKGILEELDNAPNKKSISSLIGQLTLINQSILGRMFLDDKNIPMTIEQIRQEGACLYVGIPALGSGCIGTMVNKLVFGDLLRHVNDVITGKSPKAENSIAIFFDELSSTVHEGFIDLINKCRAAKTEVFYATQSPSDLEKVTPWFLNQVLENTNNYFIFNQTVPKHTEMFAGLAGTSTVSKNTHVIEHGIRSGRSSERETESFLIHPNIFRELKVGQCAFIQRKPKRKHDVLNVEMLYESDVPVPRSIRKSIF